MKNPIKRNKRQHSTRLLWGLVLGGIVIIILMLLNLNRPTDTEYGNRNNQATDYLKYYQDPRLGTNFAFSIDAQIETEDIPYIIEKPEELILYAYDPVLIYSAQDAIDYIQKFNYSIQNYSFRIADDFQTRLYQVKPIILYNETVTFAVQNNGNLRVEYNVLSYPERENPLTKDEALSISKQYLQNHTGLPKHINQITAESHNEYYIVRYTQEINGYPIINSAEQSQILFWINQTRGCITEFTYHWPNLYQIGVIPPEIIAQPDQSLNIFIDVHNKGLSTNDTALIQEITFCYRPPVGITSKDNDKDSMCYIYLPYIKIVWDTGMTYISPILSE